MDIKVTKKIKELLSKNTLKYLDQKDEDFLCLYINNNFNIINITQGIREVIDSSLIKNQILLKKKILNQNELNKKVKPKSFLSDNTVWNHQIIKSKIFKKYDDWISWGDRYVSILISSGGVIMGNFFAKKLTEDQWGINKVNNIYFLNEEYLIKILNDIDDDFWDIKDKYFYDIKLTIINLFTVEINRLLTDVLKDFSNKVEKRKEQERLEEKQERLKEEQTLKELQVSQTNVLSELDKDGNGEVDVVEGNDFNTLLKKHQKSIVEVDKNYVQQFVKISSYLKTKKGNIQSIFNSIKDTPNKKVLNEYVEILKDEIHTYNLILFNSLNMIVSLVEGDMITFYEIHEMFDEINMFDSKHEKDVSQKLTNIGDGLESLMYEIRDMGNQISNSIDELSYITEESNKQLENQLSEIDSTMKVGNLINTINTYQNYKINKNTKSLRG